MDQKPKIIQIELTEEEVRALTSFVRGWITYQGCDGVQDCDLITENDLLEKLEELLNGSNS